jgi:hypothetical protein
MKQEKKIPTKGDGWTLKDLISKMAGKYTPEKDGDEKIGIGVERKLPANVPPLKTSDISTFEYLKLWFVSWFKNEVKAELEGRHSPLPFTLVGGFPTKTVIALAIGIIAIIAASC